MKKFFYAFEKSLFKVSSDFIKNIEKGVLEVSSDSIDNDFKTFFYALKKSLLKVSLGRFFHDFIAEANQSSTGSYFRDQDNINI